jgi:hypothetical protein
MKIIPLILIMFSASAFSQSVGIVLKKKGKADLLTNPSSKFPAGQKNVVKYNNKYYQIKTVKPGTKVENGNVVRTGEKAKLKIVFKNGDQFNVGEGTEYEISWSRKKVKGKESSVLNLVRGSLRGIVEKGGPNSGMTIKTKNAVMGVRGTDFHVGQRGYKGKTSVAVLRGKVDVASTKAPEKKVNVEQGFTADLTAQKKMQNKTVLAKTTKNELAFIQKESKISKKEAEIIEDEAIKKELEVLEKKAVEVTIKDIKTYQPELYEQIKDKKIEEVDTVNTLVVSQAFEKAPVKKAKKGFDEMELNLDEDAYKKYFKIDEDV